MEHVTCGAHTASEKNTLQSQVDQAKVCTYIKSACAQCVMPNDSKFYFAGQSINDQSRLVTASPLQGPLLITINNGVKESLPPSLTALASLVPPNIRSVAQVLESRTECQIVLSQALHAVPLQTKQPSRPTTATHRHGPNLSHRLQLLTLRCAGRWIGKARIAVRGIHGITCTAGDVRLI